MRSALILESIEYQFLPERTALFLSLELTVVSDCSCVDLEGSYQLIESFALPEFILGPVISDHLRLFSR
jgi:hypothetical protein